MYNNLHLIYLLTKYQCDKQISLSMYFVSILKHFMQVKTVIIIQNIANTGQNIDNWGAIAI